ncbi:hypothetical protein PUN28_017220 [Cardiocondyla obscurior]|uniref:Secreted protein n=1 Tax=Cardiocondyla obscurior TaxID=286306 RepID=A0AAW2EKR4_9HYME
MSSQCTLLLIPFHAVVFPHRTTTRSLRKTLMESSNSPPRVILFFFTSPSRPGRSISFAWLHRACSSTNSSWS